MGNRLFFVSEDQRVQEMNEVNIKDMLESKLQEIVEKNPDLLTREWDDQPRKLFLVAREKEVHAEEDAGNSFSLDHLLVDSEGVPILVEVKRSTDTRIRREVAAQMLDYACRASSWNIEALKELFKKNNTGRPDAEELFDNHEFWSRVSANLGAEHFRLVFVADRIPETLRILIEFMDRAMNNIEVYGVELKPYKTADGAMLLSSNIVGNSLDVRTKPTYPSRGTAKWDRESFLSRVYEKEGADVERVAESLLDLCEPLGLNSFFGRGAILANFMAKSGSDTVYQIGQAWGRFYLYLSYRDLRKLNGCKGWENDKLKDTILSIFPSKADTSGMVKESVIWIPLQSLCGDEMVTHFGEKIRSFL